MLGLVILLVTGFVIAWSGAVLYTVWTLTHPPRRTYASAVAKGRAGDPGELSPAVAFETWALRSRAHDLPVWDMCGNRSDGPIVVFVHGWGDSRVGSLVRLGGVLDECSRIVAFDLAGHGESPGACALGIREVRDVRAAIDALDSQRPVVLFGWSMGAGIAIEAASGDDRVCGVIAEAPYRLAPTPVKSVLRLQHLPYRLNLRPAFWLLNLWFGQRLRARVFDRTAHAGALDCPLLVIHGERDEICPIDDGRAVAEAGARGELCVIVGGDHNGLWTEAESRSQSELAVRGFLAGLRSEAYP